MPRRARPGRQLAAPPTGVRRQWCACPPGAVGRGDQIPGLPGGDDGMQVPQDRGGDDGLRLGWAELVLFPAGQVLVTGPVDGVGALRSQTARQAASRSPGRPCPVSRVRPVNAPGSFSRGARPACLTAARAVANRLGSPVSAKIAAAPIADRPVIEVASPVSPSSSRTAVIRRSVSASRSWVCCQSSGQQLHPLQRVGPVRDHPGRIGERGEQPAHDPQAGLPPARRVISRRTTCPEPGRPQPPGAGEVPAVPARDHRQPRNPGARPERLTIAWQPAAHQ